MKGTGQVDTQLLLPGHGVHLLERRDVVHDARIVHQHVHRPELRRAGGHRGTDRVCIRDVHFELDGVYLEGTDRFHGGHFLLGARPSLARPVVVLALEGPRVQIRHGDPGAVGGQTQGDAATDSARGTGHECDLSSERSAIAHGLPMRSLDRQLWNKLT